MAGLRALQPQELERRLRVGGGLRGGRRGGQPEQPPPVRLAEQQGEQRLGE
jgi:hypothetical protein